MKELCQRYLQVLPFENSLEMKKNWLQDPGVKLIRNLLKNNKPAEY